MSASTPQLDDREWMSRALDLAEQRKGWTSPNPTVGAVVVRRGRLVGEGCHQRAGAAHAEVAALDAAGEAARGATLYCTLEPCAHSGRTPPCTDRILAAGVSRVVVAMRDPNPRVRGRGLRALRQQGLEVVTGIGRRRATRLNEDYIKFVTTGAPWVTVKAAMSLDGKSATSGGESQWITSAASRQRGHRLRHHHDAIAVGLGTVMSDNPRLTARLETGEPARQPHRVVYDSRARTPTDARLLHHAQRTRSIVCCTDAAPTRRKRALERSGATVVVCAQRDGAVDIADSLHRLFALGITSVLVEGGGSLAFSFLAAGVVDRVEFFLAPMLIGGRHAPSGVSGPGFASLEESLRLTDVKINRLESDLWIRARVQND